MIGEVPLDNNVTEGALRSFCLHKHAWKLIDSIDGAKSSAIIYSITETAKANNLNPFRYLDHVLTVLKDHQDDTDYSFIEKLLPWSDQLPEICRSKSKTLICKHGRRKRRSKNEPVLMVYRVRLVYTLHLPFRSHYRNTLSGQNWTQQKSVNNETIL